MGVVHVLANPAAGGGGDRAAVIEQIVLSGRTVVDLTGESPEQSLAAVRAAAPERLVVVGGDGLIHLALQATAGTPTVLGLVPQGTGNDFARALGLLDRPLDATVTAALTDGVAVDGLWSNHGWVASVATVGFAGDVTERANRMSWPKGQSVYTVATLLQIPRLRALSLRLTVDGMAHDVETVMLSIGNTAYFGGGMKICPGAHPADHQCEIAIIGAVSRLTLLRVFPKVFDGGHVNHPTVTMLRGNTVSVEGADAQVWADGDPLGPLPAQFEVRPGAIRIAGART
jgi:diacylglycerol kinase (ATP)